jgi:hypothetical protein
MLVRNVPLIKKEIENERMRARERESERARETERGGPVLGQF